MGLTLESRAQNRPANGPWPGARRSHGAEHAGCGGQRPFLDLAVTVRQRIAGASPAMKFVVTVGIMSFFADFAYEGSRSITGQYLGLLGAGAFAISVISGTGEFLGYGLRLFSGRGADRTGRYWPITIGGYVLQMSVVPLLALAGNWQVAALLIILERVGKATRNPPRDAMLSHAARDIGYGRAFGVHEALDQFGAMFGPLLVALVLAVTHHDYKIAFASLAVPAVIMLSLLAVARVIYPRPQDLAAGPAQVTTTGLPRVFWLYLAAAALAGAGFADFPLISYHFARAGIVSAPLIPVFYAAAMAVSGTGSLVLGRTSTGPGSACSSRLRSSRRHTRRWCSSAGSGPAWSARRCGGWGWECRSRSSLRRSPRWFPRTGARPPTGCSPVSTASRGWSAASSSARCSTCPSPPSSCSRWLLSSPGSR